MVDWIEEFLDGGSFWDKFSRWLFVVVAGFLAIWLLASVVASCKVALGQDLPVLNNKVSTWIKNHGDAGAHASLSVWGNDDRHYQHAMEGGASARLKVGFFSVGGSMGLKWWGTDKAKAHGSFMNAEANRVLTRARELRALIHAGDMAFGGRVFRRSTQHIWPAESKNGGRERNPQFPPSNSWQVAEDRCTDGKKCPRIGYFDRLGPTLIYNPDWMRVEITALVYQWKENTYRPSLGMGSLLITPGGELKGWRILVHSELDHRRQWSVDAKVSRQIAGPVHLEIRGGNLRDPGWQNDNLFRWGVSLSVLESRVSF